MGGFSNILGHVAEGYTQAAQVDKQRQFEQEMDTRRQAGDFLQKLAMDETAHPETRNAALAEWSRIHSLDAGKKYKLDPHKAGLIQPGRTQSMTTPGLSAPAPPPGGSPQPSFTEGAAGQAPQMSMPAPPPGLSQAMTGAGAGAVETSGQPGAFMSPQDVTAMMASRAGQVAGAQAQQEMGSSIYTQPVPGGPLTAQPINKGGAAIGPGIPNAVSPYQLQGRGLRPATYVDPADNQVKIGTHNLLTGQVFDQNNQIVPNAVPFEPSLLNKQASSSQSMDAAGGIHTSRTSGPSAGAPGTGKGSGSAAQPANGKTAGSPHVTSSAVTSWQDDSSPVGLAAKRWATQGQAPKGGAMAERQVLSYMKQHGMEPALPVPPALQQKIQESFVARNSAIGLIDDVMKNSHVLDSLLSAGKIQTAINPSTGAALVTRAAGLSDKEAKVAGDFQQLVEHANLLRGPLGATGFRGHEAWQALQSQRGNLMSDPRITRQVLSGMRDRLVGLNSADKMVITGQGMTPPEQQAGPSAPPPSNGRSVGDIVSVKGKKIKITAIHPDGTFDGEPQ